MTVKWPVLIIGLVAFQWSVSAGQAERVSVGSVHKVQNQADAVYADEVRALNLSTPVLYDDLLRTGADARLLATLADGSELTLGANATMLVDDFVYDPDAGDGSLTLQVIEGAFLFVGGQVESIPGNRVEIATPVATLGVRGTTVWGGPTEGGYGIMVIDGVVDVSTDGGSVTVAAGQATIVADAQSAPTAAGIWGADRVAAAVATVTFDE